MHPHSLAAILCVSLRLAQGQPSAALGALFTDAAHNWSSSTIISFPGQASFANQTARWSVFAAPSYVAAVSPATEADLVRTLKLATANDIKFLATSGRHGYNPTLGELQDGLAIDLSLFDKLHLDRRKGTITVGPGIRFSDIIDPVYAAGYEMQLATCPCPSVIGVSIGGGIGRWGGVYGLIADALVSVRFVAANGTVLTASARENAELFWGLRGAGPNLGIVVEATYALHRIAKHKSGGGGHGLNADFLLSADKSAAYFDMLAAMSPLPARLAVVSVVLYNSSVGRAQLLSNWVYLGPEDEGRALLRPVLGLGPFKASISYEPWNKVLEKQAFGMVAETCRDGAVHDTYGVNTRQVTPSTWQSAFEKMDAFFRANPLARASVAQLELYPNHAVAAIAEDATAYPWRDATGYHEFSFTWPATTTNATVMAAAAALGRQLRAEFAATSGYQNCPGLPGGLAVYVNNAQGDEPIESIYGPDKLPRLAALKGTWDPNNVFAYHLALPTVYP